MDSITSGPNGSRTRTALGVTLIIVIIAALVLGGVEIWQVHNLNKAATCTTGKNCSPSSKTSSTNNGSFSKQKTNSSNNNAAPTTSSSTPQNAPSTNANTNTSSPLTNTGPGNTVGLFIGVVALSYLGRLIVITHKRSAN